MKELYTSYDDVHRCIEKIAAEIEKDNWECDVIVGISTGGFIPARLLKTFLKKDIYIVGLKRYNNENKEVFDLPVKIQWIDEIEKKIRNKRILLVDEIDDTRITLSYCINELLKDNPKEIRVAVLHNKNKEKKSEFPKEVEKVYVGEEIENVWIKYPWDAKEYSGYLKDINEQKKG